ncbi:hypothetical protein [Aneurinibacillus uraniidurans]|uniref:hypothetical protein n=1 Tax=Aneurinibacillus uraniidurans TaxID=2966586 RepID=UPI0023490543|nr:hypothetical protein [Aneurinibacillus sp. B1]WCN39411.1 hypothetical protein PO771_08480 [Aneurinibacillus sp. B1]
MPHYGYACKKIEQYITAKVVEGAAGIRGVGDDRVTNVFAATREELSVSSWCERLACLADSSAPSVSPDRRALILLTELEEMFGELDLSQIETDVYREWRSAEEGGRHYEERIFAASDHAFPVLLRTFLELADRMLHENGHWEYTLAETTQLLHYMCPGLFPIWTPAIGRLLYGTEQPGYHKYHGYVFALRDFFHDSSVGQQLVQRAHEWEITPVQLAYSLLAQVAQQDSSE